jgi:hypothetical protein
MLWGCTELFTGTVEYTIGNGQVFGCGISVSQDDLNTSLAGPIVEIVFDEEETTRLNSLIDGIPGTNFNPINIKRILTCHKIPEEWRVGEAIGEAYLVHHYFCYFPWPDGRDERKSGSSLPGADLVGFHQHGTTHRFVFGEVKTSSEGRYPPSLVKGRSKGLNKQLEDLQTKEKIRDDLVKYMWHRALTATWKNRFIEAFRRYISDSNDIQIFGILIRDVPPHRDDLRNSIAQLCHNCPQPMSVVLWAIYLPSGCISSLSTKVMNLRRGVNT